MNSSTTDVALRDWGWWFSEVLTSVTGGLIRRKGAAKMTRMTEAHSIFSTNSGEEFQAQGRASNRQVYYLSTIKSRKDYVPLPVGGFLEKGEAAMLLRSQRDERLKQEREARERLTREESLKSGTVAMAPSPPSQHDDVDDSSTAPESGPVKGPIVCFLDLDMTLFWGNDCNDLGCALQWVKRPYMDVVELFRILWNPEAEKAILSIKRKYDTRVVIYTRRPSLLQYSSCFRPKTISIRFMPEWRHDESVLISNEAITLNQVCIPGSVKTAQEIMKHLEPEEPLLEREKADLLLCFQRLLAARQVTQEKLMLEEAPDVVVTSTPKDVPSTARRLGVDGNRAYLWDDNEQLLGRTGVHVVDRFDSLSREQRDCLFTFLEPKIPLHSVDPQLKEFLITAPEQHRVIERTDSGQFQFAVKERDAGLSQRKWPVPNLPPLPPPESTIGQRSLKLFKRTFSDVSKILRVSSNAAIEPFRRAVSFSGNPLNTAG
eukprot:CAMPEP_0206250210 /NCGR_PEP_ID=MMETSP0047_2-20121206/21347_1 /ASSEMBLY_ACC=CAM_ASM_000192 /TAXON_ID=195065 /ORGANISM="Chroomonas mesostigmatica_cf, Strain CCMP1168" /LENGTH=487 /DNA_ID=CAMNT_0053676037 /DNA_START=318 /DNA_END=1781 /DNA_ORIENTATION=+